MRSARNSSRSVGALLLGAALLVSCATPRTDPAAAADAVAASPAVRGALAPTGSLRIAVYAGSPTSLVRQPGSDEARGMSVDIGRELAARLGVPARIVEFERVEQVIDALRSAQADMTITNASAARAAVVDFTEPLVALELGYLVLPGSPFTAIDEVDRAGVRVGVSQGSSSQAALTRAYRAASVVPAPSLKAAAEMLSDRRIDAFATNKGVLFQMADGLAGARVLDGRWGAESLAIAVPKGREAGKEWLERFAASARRQGLVQRAAQRAGLRGLVDTPSH
jgi:polar amino acid transport system substrate-binding protein